MSSSRHEGRAGRTVPPLEAFKSDDRDDKDRQQRRHEHREHRHVSGRDGSHGRHRHEERRDRDREHDRNRDRDRDLDRHRDEQSRPERHSERPRKERDASHRHSGRHGQHDHRDEHRHRHSGHDREDEYSRHRTAGEKATERSGSRHHRSHESSRGDKHRHHHDTQIVLHHKADHGQRDKAREDYQEVVGDSDAMLFSLDTRGDPLVWQFGSNDSRRIPSYDRFRRGRVVLGSSRKFAFSQEGSKILFGIEPDSASGGSVFREKNNPLLRRALQGTVNSKSKREDATLKRKKPLKHTSKLDKAAEAEEDDFVPLHAKKRKRDSDAGSESGSGADNSDQSATGDDDSDASSTSSGDANADEENCFAVGDDSREMLQKRLSELSRRVKETPQDIDAWLDLVDLQDQQSLLLGNENADQEDTRSRSKDEITGISTVKLSILESALQQNQRPSDRERLQLALMREGSKVWTSKKMAQRWTDLARENASDSGLSFLLWKARLDFEMTSLSTLTVDGIKLFITERMRALEKAAAASMDDAGKRVGIYSELIYIFLRATRFLYDAGFRDLAAAAWQATLESSFARPPTDVPGASLGEFWDSEIQRIGEEGSQGWLSYAAKIEAGEDAEEALLDYNVQKQTLPSLDFAKLAELAHRGEFHDMDEFKPLYEAWVVAERQRAGLSKLPARVIDDINDGGFEDVFRVAVFSDFSTLLFRIPDELLLELKPLLVDAFLLFCRLPPAFGTSSWIETARNDPFLATIVLSRGGDAKTGGLAPDHPEDTAGLSGRRPPDLFYDGSRIAGTFDVLFASPGWFRCLPDWLSASTPATAEEAPVPQIWIANTLRQLVRAFGLGELAPYSLAVDAMVNPAGIKKAARALIKQYIFNTALYEAYALAEVARGNATAARSVLASASSNIADAEAELPLRITWAWIELEDGQADSAVRRLILRSSQGNDPSPTATDTSRQDHEQPVSPAELLRLRQTLQTGMDYSLSSGLARRAALYAQAVVLLNYLSPTSSEDHRPPQKQSQQGNIVLALAAATSFSEEMLSRGHGSSSTLEAFLQGVARVIYFHATHGPYRPADLQAPLEKMVTFFPQNGIFLRLYAWIDPTSASGLSRLRPDNPLQRILDTVVLTRDNDCPSSRAFAIRLALQSGHGQGHTARAEFERALGGSHGGSNYNLACFGSASLWQAFVHTTAMDAMATATVTARSDGKGVRVRGVDRKMVALAKEVYYRAVRACPGSKDVLLEALEAFGPSTGLVATSSEAGMSPSDLRAVYQTIVGKGLRVHMDLDEVQSRAREYLDKYKK